MRATPFLLSAVLTLACALPGQAQSPAAPIDTTPPPPAAPAPEAAPEAAAQLSASDQDLVRRRLEYLTKKLDLDPGQQDRVYGILAEEARRISTSFNRANLAKDDKQAGHIRGEAKERIGALLTPAQRETYSQMHSGKDWLP